jgi:amino acid permease
MNPISNKIDTITVITIVLMAISIGLLDYNNLSWNANIKSYIGLIISLVSYIINRNSNKSFTCQMLPSNPAEKNKKQVVLRAFK